MFSSPVVVLSKWIMTFQLHSYTAAIFLALMFTGYVLNYGTQLVALIDWYSAAVIDQSTGCVLFRVTAIHSFPLDVFLDYWHPSFWDFYSTIHADIEGFKPSFTTELNNAFHLQ